MNCAHYMRSLLLEKRGRREYTHERSLCAWKEIEMVVAVTGHCPACGETHPVPDARSLDRKEMGCDDFREELRQIGDELIKEMDEERKHLLDKHQDAIAIAYVKNTDEAIEHAEKHGFLQKTTT